MERPLRSLDLSERFRGAESDNEKGSREGGGRHTPPLLPLWCLRARGCLPQGEEGGGGVACLCGDELLLWSCELGGSPPLHPCCCFSERGRGSVPGARPRSGHGPTQVADPTARCSGGRFHSGPAAANRTVTLIISHRDEVRQAGVKSQPEPGRAFKGRRGGEVMERWRGEERRESGAFSREVGGVNPGLMISVRQLYPINSKSSPVCLPPVLHL